MTQQLTERQIVESIDIAAPPERVFRALTDPAEVAKWWGDPTTYPATQWELDARAGGRWLSRWKNVADGAEFALGGEVLQAQPPNLLVVTWRDDRYPGLDHTTDRKSVV